MVNGGGLQMFILKCIDRKENDWGYFYKGAMFCSGKHGFFYGDTVFQTKEEARQHIKTLLNSGHIRKDIAESDFSIVEVKQHKGYGSAWYTDEEFEEAIEFEKTIKE